MEFYRLNEEEYFILSRIDGQSSLEQIQHAFESRYPTQRITPRELQSFVSDLHSKSLLCYSGYDIGTELISVAKKKRWEKIKKNLKGILSLKWRGVDPDRFLEYLQPRFGWVFSSPVVILALAIMLAAGALVVMHLDTVSQRLPGLSDFLQPKNWALLGIVIIFMKVLHELAHGLAFKRYGGECHEIGVMLLLFIPTLYCSTTDSWMLRSRWQRIVIAAAGMYVELTLAAAATFVWFYTKPGQLNMACLNIMASGSVSVLLLNGNPFLKYDGYYILSDLLELPNMLERGGKVTQSYFLRFGLGIDETEEPNSLVQTKLWLVGYRIASFGFRCLVIYLIMWMMAMKLKPFGLQNVGIAMAVLSAGFLLVPPLWSLHKFFKIPGRWHRIEMKPIIRTATFVVSLAGLLFLIPFPHHVKCSFVIEPHAGEAVFIQHDAILKEVFVLPGETVSKGQLIATLSNLDVSMRYQTEKGQVAVLETERSFLNNTRENSVDTAARLAEIKTSLETHYSKIAKLESILETMQIHAPRSGEVVPEWTPKSETAPDQLERWHGSPLSSDNLGSWLSAGEKICTIGDLKEYDAVLVINESDIKWVSRGQTAKLMLDSQSDYRYTGKISSIAYKDADNLPDSLAKPNGGNIELNPDSGKGRPKLPEDEHFEARVPLQRFPESIASGLRGTAKIEATSKTLWHRFWLSFNRNLTKQL